ncbi:hypothetical protein FALBO_5119 [Fusarium albosuccineum]|uniref:Uncharacterized protein n=1 Tax=Fusarium albosuccineum TaxID=1237068 RepID=A0A8H4PA40_9HYPO|nr:hypothetical protein FALBO_5119 [Fusarium albosuccineum]
MPAPSCSFFLLTLPLEVRRQIWETALTDTTKAVISISLNTNQAAGNLSPDSEVIHQSGVSSVALACKEAYDQWNMMSRRMSKHLRAHVRFQRTIYLLQGTYTSWKRSLLGQPTPISNAQHIAFVASADINFMAVFAAFSSFRQLETITVIVPPRFVESASRLDPCEISQIAKSLAELSDDPATGPHEAEIGHTGLLLRGDPPNQTVRDFYSRRDAPQLKLLLPRCRPSYFNDPEANGSPSAFSVIHYIQHFNALSSSSATEARADGDWSAKNILQGPPTPTTGPLPLWKPPSPNKNIMASSSYASALRNAVTGWNVALEKIRDPDAMFREELATLHRRSRQKLEQFALNPTGDNLSLVQQELLLTSHQINQLEQDHATTRTQKQHTYDSATEVLIGKILNDLIDILGPSTVKSLITELVSQKSGQEHETKPLSRDPSPSDQLNAEAEELVCDKTQRRELVPSDIGEHTTDDT